MLLHALAALGKATFEQANSLNRVRQTLPDVGPGLLRPDPGPARPRRAWPTRSSTSSGRGPKSEIGRPGQEAPEVLGGQGPGAVPPGGRRDDRAGGPGVRQGPAAGDRVRGGLGVAPGPPDRRRLEPAQGQGRGRRRAWRRSTARPGSAEDRYRLVVTVNDAGGLPGRGDRLARGEGVCSSPGRPSRWATRTGSGSTSRAGGPIGYAVTMTGFARDFGPEQKRDGKPFDDPRPGLPAGRPRARRQDPADRLLAWRSTRRPSSTRPPRSPRGAGPGSGSTPGSPHSARPAGLGARVRGGRGDPARRHDPDRGLGRDLGQLLSTWPTTC